VTNKDTRTTLGSLEICRFIAASVVVLTHFTPDLASHEAPGSKTIFDSVTMPGTFAVLFFFVLSGFVMMTAHHGDFGNVRAVPKFWWRRACRIYPMYWVALLVPVYYFYRSVSPALMVKFVSLQPAGLAGDLIPPAWSLRFEISFYIMFGLCLLPYIGRVLLAVWVAAVVWCWFPAGWLDFLGLPKAFYVNWMLGHGLYGFIAFFDFYFFAGLLAGWIFVKIPVPRTVAFALIAAGIAGLLSVLPAMHWGYDFGNPILAIPSGFAVAGLIVGLALLERSGLFTLGAAARWLGAMSYPLYILHAPLLLISYMELNGVKLRAPELFLLGAVWLLAIYVVCAVLTFCFDQPLQKLLRRRRKIQP
jgi:peptidoglycan/LPS O-acetylase OafA/YrhL